MRIHSIPNFTVSSHSLSVSGIGVYCCCKVTVSPKRLSTPALRHTSVTECLNFAASRS
ncbi:MAG: hypothetical protein ACI3XP_03560 [Eubacteriales bacterium]